MSRKSSAILAAALLGAFAALGRQVPDEPGRELAEANCNICHTLVSRVGAGYTPEGWNTVLRMMINQGAPLPADQIEPLKAYLIKSFPENGKPAGVAIPHLVQRVRRDPNTVVRFDPKSENFQSWAIPGGGNIVRNISVTRDGNFLLANSLVSGITLVTIGKYAPERILAARTQIGVRGARRTIP